MGDDDDYETLPKEHSMGVHMMAGSVAGIAEHSIMYPVDCVKTRMQCLCPHPHAEYRGVVDALYRIVRHEGIRKTVRGINAVVTGAGPAHAMYFACYEQCKKMFSGTRQGTPLTNAASGCLATLFHDAVMNPAEVIKQRMQVYQSPYKTCLDCARLIWHREGLRAFYHSYTTQLMMNIPFQSTHFVTYEIMQDWLNIGRDYRPATHCISGAAAGAVAAAITTPLDMCKTLLNTQEECALRETNSPVKGMIQACRTIYQFGGVPGFFKGTTARVIYQMPGTAVTWSVYEFLKNFLNSKNTSDDYFKTATVTVAASDSSAVSEL